MLFSIADDKAAWAAFSSTNIWYLVVGHSLIDSDDLCHLAFAFSNIVIKEHPAKSEFMDIYFSDSEDLKVVGGIIPGILRS